MIGTIGFASILSLTAREYSLYAIASYLEAATTDIQQLCAYSLESFQSNCKGFG